MFDVVAAANQTVELAKRFDMDNTSSEECPLLDYDHLVQMSQQIEGFIDKGNREKANRWLGWMQAAVYAGGGFISDESARIIFEKLVLINTECSE